MKKYKYVRRAAAILSGVLMLNSFAGAIPYIQSYAYTEKAATVNASSLNVRSGPGTSSSIVTKLTSGASVTVIGEQTASDGALWYQIRFKSSNGKEYTGYVSKSFLRFQVAYTGDADFESRLAAEGFPESYKDKLRQLHAQYPQWVFRAQKTGLDWNTAVKEESQVGRTLVSKSSMSSWKSIADGAYDWSTSVWTSFDGSSWVAASEDIVKYYMDPRNFLDETNIFQFLNHSYDSNAHTMEGLQTMVKGTFLSGEAAGGGTSSSPGTSNPGGGTGSPDSNGGSSNPTDYGPGVVNQGPGSSGGGSGEVSLEGPHASIVPKNQFWLMSNYGPGYNLTGPSGDSAGGGITNGTTTGSTNYTNILMNAATQSGVNPYVLAAMIIQEQGSGGTGRSVSGTVSGYEGYYNFFNIESYKSGNMEAVERGLWWASQSGSYNRPWNSPESSILGGSLYYGNNYVKVGQDTFYLKKFNVQGSNIYKHQYMTNVQGAAGEGAVYAKAYNDQMKQTALEFKIPVYNNMPDNPCSQPTQDGSPNYKLGNLGVEGFVITPTFSRDTLEYNLIVDPSVSSINVLGTVLDSTASVHGTGTVTLQGGNNDVKVSVTAQNGGVRDYIIHVVRQNNGPTYSASAGGSTGSNPGGSTGNGNSNNGSTGSGGPGAEIGPGVSQPSSGGSTPGGSSVTIAPYSSGLSGQSASGVILEGPGKQIQTAASQETGAAAGSTGQPAGASPAASKGDVNQDGKINSQDSLRLQQYILGLSDLSAAEKGAADLNGDGKVNSQDMVLLQKHILGI